MALVRAASRQLQTLKDYAFGVVGFGCALLLSLTTTIADEPDLQLRITWGGGTERRAWRGELLLNGGRFLSARRLGLEPDLPGAMETQEALVRFRERTPTVFDGFDLQLEADDSRRLTIQLFSGSSPPKTFDLPLGDFFDDHTYVFHTSLDEHQNRLLVRRAPGDPVRVVLDGDSHVFAPGEVCSFRVKPTQLGVPAGTSVRVLVQLVDSHGKVLWTESFDRQINQQGSVDAIPQLQRELPNEEGVYAIQVDVTQRRFAGGLIPTKTLAQGMSQLVVIEDRPSTYEPVNDELPWSDVVEIDLSDPSWWRTLNWLPQFGRRSPIGNGQITTVQHRGDTFHELAGDDFYAVPIPVTEVGKPHLLELEYPNDIAQTLGLTIMEKNAAGAFVPIFLDSGFDVPSYPPAEIYKVDQHRLVFWPRTETPWLLFTNRRQRRPAVFGKLRVRSGLSQLPEAAVTPHTLDARLLAVYYDKPLFAQNFMAQETIEASTTPPRSLNDWRTFYEGGRRLVEYLRFAGYNSAIVSVARDGSSLYPSQLLQPTPRYDNGAFFVTGQDPVQKDVLEMLFRQFDRIGLKLIPALHFATPLPELERQLQSNPASAEGIELVNERGESYLRMKGAERGLAPYYNPLDQRVQRAVQRVVQELVERYGHHPSFHGVSLQVGPQTFLQFPDEEWGRDRRTWARFRQAMIGEASTPSQVRQAWLDWRAAELAEFHHAISRVVAEQRPDAKVFLAMADSLTADSVQQEMRPRIPSQGSFSDAMLRLGIDSGKYQGKDNLVLLRPRRYAPLNELFQQSVDFEINRSSEVDRFFQAAASHGVQNVHPPMELRLAEFDAMRPFGETPTTTWLSAHISPSGDFARARFTNSLAASDTQVLVDGGWMLPLGQEDAVRGLLATYRSLPAQPFETIESTSESAKASTVRVRSLAWGGKTFCYVLNNGPWSVNVAIELDASDDCRAEGLDGRKVGPLKENGPSRIWQVALHPYDLRAVVFVGTRAEPVDWQMRFGPGIENTLRKWFHDVNIRRLQLDNPQPLAVLSNHDFEEGADTRQIPGWKFSHLPGVHVTAEPDPITGRRGLHFQVTNPRTGGWVRSDPFRMPATGRIAVSAWIRTTSSTQPPLRIAVDVMPRGKPTVSFYAPLGKDPQTKLVDEQTTVQPLGEAWPESPFLLHVKQLPIEGPANVAVGFDLMGEGEVWIDDVQVYDLFFDKTERGALQNEYAPANYDRKWGKFATSQQYLNSYWPRFLLEFVPAPAAARLAALPNRSPPDPPETTPADEKAKSRSWSRLVPQIPLRWPRRSD